MASCAEKLKLLKEGQSLLIETNAGELLTGTLKSLNIKYLTIELDNVRDIKANYTYQSSQLLSYPQMKSVKVMLNENEDGIEFPQSKIITDSDSIVENSTTCKLSNNATINVDSSYRPQTNFDQFSTQLTALDLDLIQKQLDGTIFIAQTDHKYHKALSDIKAQSVIGLLIDPVEKGRNCKTSLMAVSTPQNIYIFDMLALGKIFKEIRSILQAERPRKAVHFSHKIVDHLKYRHNVELKGIFDTFLAYCVVTNEKILLTLEETIQKIFCISDVYFKVDLENELPAKIYQRPLPRCHCIAIAKKVAFQRKLYDYLLHECMLKNFYSQCETFSQTFCNNNDNFQVGQQLHPNSRAGFEHIQPNGNWKENLNIELTILNDTNIESVL